MVFWDVMACSLDGRYQCLHATSRSGSTLEYGR